MPFRVTGGPAIVIWSKPWLPQDMRQVHRCRCYPGLELLGASCMSPQCNIDEPPTGYLTRGILSFSLHHSQVFYVAMSFNTQPVYYPQDPHGPIFERRNAVDYHAMGLPRDHWHAGMRTDIVGNRATVGVAFTECEYGGEGVELRHTPMSTLLREDILARGPRAQLSITWPGYQHLGYYKNIRMDTTIGDLARQVATIFKTFYDEAFDSGPAHVTYDRIRLRNIFFDGYFWNLEVSYVYEDARRWDLK
ncbi:hypothetical protein DFP72DRAFT_924016 [Ephemerocybe angulata]|uniref:Uncharacterized protein n=1 Tax=Ephemerocybe angulata TaxID=980116 RepID=A0A8H6LYR7_9AGAR|nr:hypothetical protein DFP72DRAFT_924016 [Tulosesus angulatus]